MRSVTLEEAARIVAERGAGTRQLTAIAGPPASGKLTAAEMLESALNRIEPQSASVVPMDGFHYDDAVLIKRGLKARKGAPETFDVGGLRALLARLRSNNEEAIAIPVFDRDLEIARAGARVIERSVRHIIVEGNYLLLRQEPWRDLAESFDTTFAIASDIGELRKRLEVRWKGYGLAGEMVIMKVEENDLPNARLVLKESADPEFWLTFSPSP